jgi:hypothetical protein
VWQHDLLLFEEGVEFQAGVLYALVVGNWNWVGWKGSAELPLAVPDGGFLIVVQRLIEAEDVCDG